MSVTAPQTPPATLHFQSAEALDTASSCSELSTCVTSSSATDSQELIRARSVDDSSLLLHAGQKRTLSLTGHELTAGTETEQNVVSSPGVEVCFTIYRFYTIIAAYRL